MLKVMTRLLLLGLVVLLAGCATTYYGVSEESWQVMSEVERAESRRQYNERRTAEANARAAREKRLKVEREAELLQLEADLEERRQRAALIYRGKLGRPGDLLRVTIRDGAMSLRGHHRSYRTTEFLIAAGDVKRVPILFNDRRAQGQTLDLYASYLNGRLWIDTDQYGRKTERALQLIYQDDWHGARVFAGVRSRGTLELSRVTVEVEAVDLHHRHRPVASPPPVQKVVVEKTVVNKTTVVNKVDMRVKNRAVVKNKTVNNNQTHITNVGRVNNKTRVNNTNVTNTHRKIIENSNNRLTKNKPVTKVTKVVHGNHETQDADDALNKRRQKVSRKKQGPENREKVEKEDDDGREGHGQRYRKLKVKVRGGMIRLGNKNIKIKPETYNFAYGETREIKLKTNSVDPVKIWVRCKPEALLFSENGAFDKRSKRLAWEPGWKKGEGYKVQFKNSASMKDVKVTIKAES